MKSRGKTLALSIVVLLTAAPARGGELSAEHCAVQVSSDMSDGKLSLEEIVRTCREQKVRVVILAERDLMKWEYGVWPFRNLFKKTVEDNSVLRFGADRYLARVRRCQAANPDMLIIPGVESAPFYYWSGNPLGADFKINDWHRHMMSAGFSTADDYERLPVIGNRKGLARKTTAASFVPFGFCFAGIALMFTGRKFLYFAGIALTCVSFLKVIDTWPYGDQAYDQYSGDLGIKPYQRYIQYCDSRKAVTFWTHPEARNLDRSGAVAVETVDYSDLLARIDGYTGFFIFYEGYGKVGAPGGIWDTILEDYCRGRRARPVWAAAGLAVDNQGLEQNLKGLRTVVLLPALSEDEVISAMGKGRMYVARGPLAPEFLLDDFSVSNVSGRAVMGEELAAGESHTLRISGHLLNGQRQPFRIKLIRDAKVVKIFEAEDASFAFTYEGRAGSAGRGYYRAEITGPAVQVITNPVFYSG